MVGWKLKCEKKKPIRQRVQLECFHVRNHSKLGLRCYSDGWLEAETVKTYIYPRVHLECFHARNHSKLGLRCYFDGWLEVKL